MKPESGYKYLVNSDKDQMWGITVDTVGSETVPPGYEVYPPRVDTLRVSILMLGKAVCWRATSCSTSPPGGGVFYGRRRERTVIGAGDMILLRPNRWHSYMPDRETGWHEY